MFENWIFSNIKLNCLCHTQQKAKLDCAKFIFSLPSKPCSVPSHPSIPQDGSKKPQMLIISSSRPLKFCYDCLLWCMKVILMGSHWLKRSSFSVFLEPFEDFLGLKFSVFLEPFWRFQAKEILKKAQFPELEKITYFEDFLYSLFSLLLTALSIWITKNYVMKFIQSWT